MNEDQVRSQIRESIKLHVNGRYVRENEEDDLDESAVLSVGLPVMVYGIVRSLRKKRETDKLYRKFLEKYDNEDILGKGVTDTLRRFQLVSNLTDLEKMEERSDRLVNQIKNMESRVDEFIDQEYRDEKSIGDYVFITNPAKEKRRLKKDIKFAISEVRKAFEHTIEMKKDELMS